MYREQQKEKKMTILFLNENIVDEYKEISKEDKAALDVLNFVGDNYKAGLSVKLVSTTICTTKTENKEEIESEVRNVVEINNQAGIAANFLRQTVSSEYKRVSEVVNSQPKKKQAPKKSMKDLMKQSVFHGQSWMGNNFIA